MKLKSQFENDALDDDEWLSGFLNSWVMSKFDDNNGFGEERLDFSMLLSSRDGGSGGRAEAWSSRGGVRVETGSSRDCVRVGTGSSRGGEREETGSSRGGEGGGAGGGGCDLKVWT